MRASNLLLACALLVAPAQSQENVAAPVEIAHNYASHEAGALAKVEIQTLVTARGTAIQTLKVGGETPTTLAYTDEVRTTDAIYMGNERAAIVPGAKNAVSLFQLMPSTQTHEYSPAIVALCGGKGIPFIGIESPGKTSPRGAPDLMAPLRLYVMEETFEPGKVVLRLCKAIDLSPVR